MALREEGYWDRHYEEELKNFEENGDEGDVWFGKALTRKIVTRVVQEISDGGLDSQDRVNILDIGCGNGFLICKLSEELIATQSHLMDKVHLIGIDYAIKSIELSTRILKSRDSNKLIQLEQCDFLDHNQLQIVAQDKKFDIVIDKGTFDAICLLSEDGQQVKTKYMESIYSVVKPGSIFILASCNHTDDEIIALLNEDGPFKYRLLGRIETPKLKFGGVEGSQVCCLVIKFD